MSLGARVLWRDGRKAVDAASGDTGESRVLASARDHVVLSLDCWVLSGWADGRKGKQMESEVEALSPKSQLRDPGQSLGDVGGHGSHARDAG